MSTTQLDGQLSIFDALAEERAKTGDGWSYVGVGFAMGPVWVPGRIRDGVAEIAPTTPMSWRRRFVWPSSVPRWPRRDGGRSFDHAVITPVPDLTGPAGHQIYQRAAGHGVPPGRGQGLIGCCLACRQATSAPTFVTITPHHDHPTPEEKS